MRQTRGAVEFMRAESPVAASHALTEFWLFVIEGRGQHLRRDEFLVVVKLTVDLPRIAEHKAAAVEQFKQEAIVPLATGSPPSPPLANKSQH